MVRMTRKFKKRIRRKIEILACTTLVCLISLISISKSSELEKFVMSKTNDLEGISNYETDNNEQAEGNNKLKTLEVIGFHLKPDFSPNVREYELEKLETQTSVEVFATAYHPKATINITGNNDLTGEQNKIKIVVSAPDCSEDAEYTITCNNITDTKPFSYTGDYKEFIAPYSGIYKMETWGARGGGSRMNGSYRGVYGKGGYAKGEIALKKGEKLYVYVGGQGADAVVGRDSSGGYNGGGLGTWDRADNESSGGGGGATDIRLISGEWNNITSLRSRIMVAGRRRWRIMVL